MNKLKLSELFDTESDVTITGLAIDSRKVKAGDLFFCLEGTVSDGHLYAVKAAQAGAAAIVHSKPVEQIDGVIYIQVDDVTGELNRVCDLFNGSPSKKMTIFGITGTNGKTTIASIIKSIYSHHTPTGYIGTIGVQYDDVSRNASLTTPSQTELHADLAEMYEHGIRAAAIEVSSHGLTQRRTETIDIDCAIFTQLTHEHLDYHGTMEAYLEAKMLLFSGMKPDGIAVLNADDDISIEKLKGCCACPYVTYGLKDDTVADYKASDIVLGPRYTHFTLTHDGVSYPVRSNLIAEYNISNLLAVIAAVNTQGMALEDIIPLLDTIPQVAGRMEVIDEGQDYHVIVDFAHTPDAFEKVFTFAEKVRTGHGKVYAVFGSSGRRDTEKRPVMGEIAGRYCDEIVTTQDDPRDEDPAEIGAVILEGAKRSGCDGIFLERRADAIEYIIKKARKDDMVLLLGQGRQPYVIKENGYRDPYDGDHITARRLIRQYMNEEK